GARVPARLSRALRARQEHPEGGNRGPRDYFRIPAQGQPGALPRTRPRGISSQLTDIDQAFATVASFPEWKQTPIVIGESAPEGCAACSARVYKQNGYRN